MKRFFCIFLYFLTFSLLSFANDATKFSSVYSLDKVINHIDSFQTATAPENCSTPIQPTPFGSIQILFSDSGTYNVKNAIFALHVTLLNGYLKEPLLAISNAKNGKSPNFFYPIDGISQNSGYIYSQDVTFPFFIQIENNQNDISFDLTFKCLWCYQNDCVKQNYTIPVVLHSGYNYLSRYRAFIFDSFRKVPQQASANKTEAFILNDDSFWLFIKTSDIADELPSFTLFNKQNVPLHYILKQSQINNDEGLFIFNIPQVHQVENIIVKTARHFYSVKLNQTKKNLPKLTENNTYSIPWYMWMIFLLFSPAISLLFGLHLKNEIIARQKIRSSILGVMFGILSGVIIYSIWPYTYLINSKIWLIFCLLLFTFLSLKKIPMNAYAYGILTAILPYFSMIMNEKVTSNTSDLFIFFSKLGLLNIAIFIVFLIKPTWIINFRNSLRYSSAKITLYPLVADSILFLSILLVHIIRL